MKTIDSLVRKNIQALKPYTSAREEFVGTASIYLDANESPYGDGLNRYPDPYHTKVKKLLAQQNGFSTDQIALGNGSDELLDLIVRVFCEPGKDNIIITPPTFGIYKVLANTNDVEVRESHLDDTFQLNTIDIINKIDENTKLVFICSPNNPTGNLMNRASIQKLLEILDCIVVIDEAYIDFTDQESWKQELNKYPNLIVTQTLSKAMAHAGIRLGICFASPEIITYVNKIRLPYNLNTLSQQKAVDVLSDAERYHKNVEAILSERKGLSEALASLSSVRRVFPSDANFFLVQFENANAVYNHLVNDGIIVRNVSNTQGCSECLRITMGTPEENKKLISSLQNFK